MSESGAKYKSGHKTNRSEYNAKWYIENKERLAKSFAENYISNIDERLKSRRMYYLANRDDCLKKMSEYHKTINGKSLKSSRQRKRRAIKRGAEICDFTHSQWIALQEAFNHCCAYCGGRFKGRLTQDHITPLTKGGNHTLSNIVPSCRKHNAEKGTGSPLSIVQPFLLLGVS